MKNADSKKRLSLGFLITIVLTIFIWSGAYAAKTVKYTRTILVSPVGTVKKNGTALLNALSGITDASQTNPYLIKIEPGIYDLSTNTLVMKSYVDIEGSGEEVTRITASGNANPTMGTVRGANNVEIRSLSVENTGGYYYAKGISNFLVSPRITHVTSIAQGGTLNCGIYNFKSSPKITNVIATAQGGTWSMGILNEQASPTMDNLIASGSGAQNISYGVDNEQESAPTMTNVRAFASGGGRAVGIYNSYSSPTLTNVTAIASDGTSRNDGISNNGTSDSGVPPAMNNVIARALGGNYSAGVSSFGSSPLMINVTASAMGAEYTNTGVHNGGQSALMINVTAFASGPNTASNIGVSNFNSSPTIQKGTISAEGGYSNYGIYNQGDSSSPPDTYVVKINNSQIKAGSQTEPGTTIFNDHLYTTYVGASKLEGDSVYPNGGTVVCAGVYDEDYVFYPGPNCP